MRGWGIWLVLTACSYHTPSQSGDDDGGTDGTPAADAAPDAALLPCDYTEQEDTTNGTTAGAELTGLTFGAPIIVCGQVDTSQLSAANVDLDAYRFTVPATTDVLFHLTGEGLDTLDGVVIQMLDIGGSQIALGTLVGTHATLPAHLPTGDYVLGVRADSRVTPASPIAYRLTVVSDQPEVRCPKGATMKYVEANDGPSSDGNDMVAYDTGIEQKSLTPEADVPEPAGDSAPALQITGIADNVNALDNYQDRDAYELKTGATTTQLTVRLDWTNASTDLDLLALFKDTAKSFGGGLSPLGIIEEYDTFAVEPDTRYWVWVGAFDGSSAPASYDITICNEQLALPSAP